MTLHENEHTVITVHTWTAIFLEHLVNTSFLPRSRLELSPFLASPSEHASCCHAQPSIFAVYLSWSSFTPNAFLLSRWLLANVWVNYITTLHDICAHMYIHHISITILLSFLHIFHSSWQAGWSRPLPSDTIIVPNGKGQGQPACQLEWKTCEEENE
jgi:hypothetical protein